MGTPEYLQQFAQLGAYALMLAILPSLVVMALFFFADRYEREPLYMLFRCLMLGAATVIPLAVIQVYVPFTYTMKFDSVLLSRLYRTSVLAPVFEESLKYLVFMLIVIRSKHFNEPFDAIVYYVAVAIGFSIIEDWGYIAGFSYPSFSEGVKTGDMAPFFIEIIKMFGIRSWPGHALFGAISGYFIAVGRFIKRKQRTKYYILALIVGMASHSIWNTICVFSYINKMNSSIFLAPYVDILFIIIVIAGKKLLKASPFNKPVKEMFTQDFKALLVSRSYSKKNLGKFFRYVGLTIIVMAVIEVASSLIIVLKFRDIY